jgi:transcription initiation factor TFIIF subunit beta
MADTKDSNGDGADPLMNLGVTDSSNISNGVWMIRLPNKLAAVWNDAPEGTVLGELVFKKGGKLNGQTIKPNLSVNCEESLVTSTSLPLHYSMEAMTKKVPNLYPFERKEDGSITITGTVTRSANLQASRDDPRYRQLAKNRLLDTSVNNSRFVKPVEATELSVRKSLAKNQGFGSAVMAFGQRQKDDLPAHEQDSRKRKYEDTPTRSVVFELFSFQPYWTVKQLKEESGKPEKELRATLNDIGDYHRSGEHKNMWALKEEYRLVSQEK